ncbi:MAG: DNA-binding domain-containing protein [Myxococcales bacterium]|nr:DNA-binding domain-containing protein [Myxococcales bacterium]
MQRFPDLRGVQSLFWRLVAAPEGVAAAVGSEDLSYLIRPDARLGAVERLDIYADMYFYRLRDCLAEDFPKLAARVGAAHFHNLVTDYLLAHPPRHFSLRELGRALPDFTGSHALERSFPALADLARLEWARVEVFDDADAAPLCWQRLLEGGAAAPESFAATLIPSARLLRLDASVLALWRGDPAEPGERIGVRVWRKGFAVHHRSLATDEERCLRELAAGGVTLARLGELVGNAPRLAALLDLWARDGLIAESEARDTPDR